MKEFKYANKESFLKIFPKQPQKMSFWFSILEAAYTQKNRYYHNLQHIDELLDSIENVLEEVNFPVINEHIKNNFRIYAWFHDVICHARDFSVEVQKSLGHIFDSISALDDQNNKLSSDLLKTFLHDIFGFEPQQGLAEFKDWRANPFFSDLDYLIFAKPIERVLEYDDQIEDEVLKEVRNECKGGYSVECQNLEKIFNYKRYLFLIDTYNNEVFKTEVFRKKYTDIAKRNIEVLFNKYASRDPFNAFNKKVPKKYVLFHKLFLVGDRD